MKLKYAVVYTQTPNNYCAYSPDVPGCISTGKDWEHIQEMIKEAITFHLELMLEYDDPLPYPQMSLEEAIAYHNRPYSEDEKQELMEYGYTEEDFLPDDDYPPRFRMVEVEIRTPEAALTAD